MREMKLFWGGITFCAITSFAPLASAQTTWTGDGDGTTWTNAANWDNGVPSATSGAFFTITSANVTLSTNQSVLDFYVTGTVDSSFNYIGSQVTLNTGAGDTLTVVGVAPTLNGNSSIFINGAGADPVSTLTLNGGTIDVEQGLISNYSGVLNLNSTTLDYDFQSAPGEAYLTDEGTVNQTGTSIVTTGYVLDIGADENPGTYTTSNTSILQTGTFQTSGNYFIDVGVNSTNNEPTADTVGTLTISGSSTLTLNATAQLQLGTVSSVIGTNSIAPGTLGGTGFLIQNGAESNVNVDADSGVYIGALNGGVGTYDLEAGNLTMTGSTMIIGDGASTTGELIQTGGIFNSDTNSFIGIGANGLGTYELSAGNANLLGGISVGDDPGGTGSGTLTQTGGTLVTGVTTSTNTGLYVGGPIGTSPGIYNLSGTGTATVNGGMVVGATGIVNQSGGTMIITLGQTLDLSTLGGSYNLSGGTLQVGNNGVNGLFGTTGEGTLNFEGGTLQALSGSTTTDALDGTVTGISTLDTTNANIDLEGKLSGTGGFNIVGGGTVTYASGNGDITYSGATTITAGTLVTDASNIEHSSTIDLVGSGSTSTLDLTVDAGGNTGANKFTGIVTGAGTLNVGFTDSGDTLELGNAAANSFTGTINLGYNGTSDTVPGNLQIFNGSFGAITGSGSGVIIGGDSGVASSGTVTFSQDETYTGLTTVDSGFTLKALNLGGALTNNGTFGINTANPSTITINGDLTSSGTLLFRYVGGTPDLYQINGTTNLSGGSGILSGSGTTPVGGVVVLNSTGALSGFTEGNYTSSNALFSASLTQSGNQLILNTTQVSLSSFALTPNELAVANALDPVLTTTGLPGNLGIALNGLSAAQIPSALDELSPEVLQYARTIAFENATFLTQQVNGVLANVRLGYAGLDGSGISVVSSGFNSGLGQSLTSLLAYDPPSFNKPAPNGVNYYPQPAGYSPMTSTPPSSESSPSLNSGSISDSPNPDTMVPPSSLSQSESGFKPVMSEFILGNVVLADMNQDQSAPNAAPDKASYTASNATAGISFRMTNNLAAGVLFNYNHTDAKTDSNGSKTDVDSYSPGVYATWFDKGFYVNGLFSYGYNNYTNTRSIPFLGATANSSPSGEQYVTNLDFGYDFQPKNNREWIFGPTLGLTYTHLDINSFTESGAGPADLAVNSQSLDSLRSQLGGHVIYQARAGSLLFQPNFTAMWQHEYLNNPGITSQFNVPGTNPFTIQTATTGNNSALLGCGLTVTLDNSMAFYVNYLADVGSDDFWAQSIVGGFKASF